MEKTLRYYDLETMSFGEIQLDISDKDQEILKRNDQTLKFIGLTIALTVLFFVINTLKANASTLLKTKQIEEMVYSNEEFRTLYTTIDYRKITKTNKKPLEALKTLQTEQRLVKGGILPTRQINQGITIKLNKIRLEEKINLKGGFIENIIWNQIRNVATGIIGFLLQNKRKQQSKESEYEYDIWSTPEKFNNNDNDTKKKVLLLAGILGYLLRPKGSDLPDLPGPRLPDLFRKEKTTTEKINQVITQNPVKIITILLFLILIITYRNRIKELATNKNERIHLMTETLGLVGITQDFAINAFQKTLGQLNGLLSVFHNRVSYYTQRDEKDLQLSRAEIKDLELMIAENKQTIGKCIDLNTEYQTYQNHTKIKHKETLNNLASIRININDLEQNYNNPDDIQIKRVNDQIDRLENTLKTLEETYPIKKYEIEYPSQEKKTVTIR